jgi:hypothetical protein
MSLINRTLHQLLPLCRIGNLNANHPSLTISVVVHDLRLCLKERVDLHDLAAERHIKVGNGFDGFYCTKNLMAPKGFAVAGQFDENDIPQLALSKIRDSHGGDISIQGNPFVFSGVSESRGKFHMMKNFGCEMNFMP